MNSSLLTISLFRHPRHSSAGIHPKKSQDGCPINNVGHDHDGDRFKTRSAKRISLRDATPHGHRSFPASSGRHILWLCPSVGTGDPSARNLLRSHTSFLLMPFIKKLPFFSSKNCRSLGGKMGFQHIPFSSFFSDRDFPGHQVAGHCAAKRKTGIFKSPSPLFS